MHAQKIPRLVQLMLCKKVVKLVNMHCIDTIDTNKVGGVA